MLPAVARVALGALVVLSMHQPADGDPAGPGSLTSGILPGAARSARAAALLHGDEEYLPGKDPREVYGVIPACIKPQYMNCARLSGKRKMEDCQCKMLHSITGTGIAMGGRVL